MPTFKHPSWDARFQAVENSPTLEQAMQALDIDHDIRELIGKPVIICSAEPYRSDYGPGVYVTLRLDDGDSQRVYVIGGNAGRQALSLAAVGRLPVKRVLSVVKVNGHELFYWRKIRESA
jgi:hypothetical protein